jgi:hypothetical protein
MRKLPSYLAGGPIVSDLAYAFVVLALEGGDTTPRAAADTLSCDEADVLRAMGELERAGVFEDPSGT